LPTRRAETQTRLRLRLEDSSPGSSKGDSREGQETKTAADGRIKRQEKKTPVQGRVKEAPGRVSEEDSSRGSGKEHRPVLPSGKTHHDINPATVLPSVQIWLGGTEGFETKTDWMTNYQLQSNSTHLNMKGSRKSLFRSPGKVDGDRWRVQFWYQFKWGYRSTYS